MRALGCLVSTKVSKVACEWQRSVLQGLQESWHWIANAQFAVLGESVMIMC